MNSSYNYVIFRKLKKIVSLIKKEEILNNLGREIVKIAGRKIINIEKKAK